MELKREEESSVEKNATCSKSQMFKNTNVQKAKNLFTQSWWIPSCFKIDFKLELSLQVLKIVKGTIIKQCLIVFNIALMYR